MIDVLSIERFHELVASYGADPDRWPAELRARAVACLVEAEAARAAWRAANELDTNLDLVTSPDSSPELVEAVLAIADVPVRPNASGSATFIRQVIPTAAAAAIALIGGLSVPSPWRDGSDAVLQNEVAVSAPVITEDNIENDDIENDDILTTLALIDTNAIADDETVTGDAIIDESPLLQLPLL